MATTADIGTVSSTLTCLGEPGSTKLKLNRTSPLDHTCEQRTPDLTTSFVNISHSEPVTNSSPTKALQNPNENATIIDKDPTPQMNASLPKVPNDTQGKMTDKSSNIERVIENIKKHHSRQDEVTKYIADAHVAYTGNEPLANLYRSMPFVDSEVLVKQSWSQIIERFPEIQKTITHPGDTDINALVQPIHTFLFQNIYTAKISPSSKVTSHQARNKRSRSASEGSYTQTRKYRAGNDGDNCARPIDARDDSSDTLSPQLISSSSSSIPPFISSSSPTTTSYLDPPLPQTSTPRQVKRQQKRRSKSTRDRLRKLGKDLRDSPEDLEQKRKLTETVEAMRNSAEELDNSRKLIKKMHAHLDNMDNRTGSPDDQHETLSKGKIKIKHKNKRVHTNTDTDDAAPPEKYQRDEEELMPLIKPLKRRKQKKKTSKPQIGKGKPANNSPQKTKTRVTLIPQIISQIDSTQTQQIPLHRQAPMKNPNHADDPNNPIRVQGPIDDEGASTSKQQEIGQIDSTQTQENPGYKPAPMKSSNHLDDPYNPTRVQGPINEERESNSKPEFTKSTSNEVPNIEQIDIDEDEWQTKMNKHTKKILKKASMDSQAAMQPDKQQLTKQVSHDAEVHQPKYALPAFHLPRGIQHAKGFIFAITRENPEIKPNHISFRRTKKSGREILLPQNINTANRLKYPVKFQGHLVELDQVGAEKWNPYSVQISDLHKADALSTKHIYNNPGVLQIRLEPNPHTVKHKMPTYNLLIKYQNREAAPNALYINGIRYPTKRYDPPQKQCFQCQKWGHIMPKCQATSPKCAYCADKHPSKECKDKIKQGLRVKLHCVNCGEAHPAMDKSCREYKGPAKINTNRHNTDKKIPDLRDLNLEHTSAARRHRAQTQALGNRIAQTQGNGTLTLESASTITLHHSPDNQWGEPFRTTLTVLKVMRKHHPQVAMAIDNVASKLVGARGRNYVKGMPLYSSHFKNYYTAQHRRGNMPLLPTPPPAPRLIPY